MKKIIYVFFLLSLVACDKGFHGKIEDKIQQSCNGSETCKVNMSEITDFEWDNMYVFNNGVSLEQINQVIGFNYGYFEDIADRIIFTKSKSVVYHEDNFPNPEKKSDKKIYFSFPSDTTNYLAVKKGDAIFTAKKVVNNNKEFYILSLSK